MLWKANHAGAQIAVFGEPQCRGHLRALLVPVGAIQARLNNCGSWEGRVYPVQMHHWPPQPYFPQAVLH